MSVGTSEQVKGQGPEVYSKPDSPGHSNYKTDLLVGIYQLPVLQFSIVSKLRGREKEELYELAR